QYRNIIVISLDNSETSTGIFEKNIQGIKSGFDIFGNKIYRYLDSSAKTSESGQYIQFSIHNEIKKLMFFITKIIENEIISLHLKLGFLPVHSSLCLNETNKYSLVLGNSQSGKTTFCTTNQRVLISDDINFISMEACLPFGHYYKKYINPDTPSTGFIESFQSFEREVHKLGENRIGRISLRDIEEIIFLEVGNFEAKEFEISNTQEKMNFLLNVLLDIPNHFFLDSAPFSILILPIVNTIVNNKIFIKQRSVT
ncbi:phosphoenolpyruvate carboxykinase (ATP), partial [Listeria monocytogenes]|nr:phosphoenolpyruvate carboxykinase (ATP) [Listeria monocytogenes]